MYSLDQSTENPSLRSVRRIFPIFAMVSSLHISLNFSRGTSFFVIPWISSTFTSVGRPWQSHPWGNMTLYPCIRLYRAIKSM